MDQMEQEAPAQEGGGDVQELVSQVGMGLAKLAEAVPPEHAEEFAGILGAYQQFVDKMSGGGGSAPAKGAQPMEAGAGGKPYSPAGV